MKIEDCRVLITGGTRGIGRALAHELRDRGARVMVCGSHPDGVASARAEPGIVATCCDVTEAEDVRALVEAVDIHLGGLEVLVHCAGIQQALDFTADVDMADVERELAVNLLAPIRLTHALLPRLMEAERATVVNVTSILAMAPKQRAPVYCATKAGLVAWTTSLRHQLEGRGVSVMELVPPLVATRMTRGRDQDAIEPEVVAQACIDGLERGDDVVRVGKARLAHLVHRVAPSLLARRLRHA